MRTPTRVAPVPKLASNSGAYTLTRRVPKVSRTAAVASTTSEPSGSLAPDLSISRFPAATPCWASTAHLAGSQARMAPALTGWTAAGLVRVDDLARLRGRGDLVRRHDAPERRVIVPNRD